MQEAKKKIRTIFKCGNSLIVAIPKEVRKNLNLKLGDNIVFVYDGNFVQIEKVEM